MTTLNCNLSNQELIDKCNKWVHDLIETGGNAWTLRVPAEVNRDPDILFCELIQRFEKLQQLTPAIDWDEQKKEIAVKFFRYWWNTPGINTDEGFDEWWKEHKSEFQQPAFRPMPGKFSEISDDEIEEWYNNTDTVDTAGMLQGKILFPLLQQFQQHLKQLNQKEK